MPESLIHESPGTEVRVAESRISGWLLQAWTVAKMLGAADLHAVSNEPIRLRLHGELSCIDNLPPCPPAPWPEVFDLFKTSESTLTTVETSLTHPTLGRARASLAAHQGGWMLVMRLIAEHIPTLADVQLSRRHADLVLVDHGLLLVTGATGSGKSSTLAAWLGHWREQRRGHVISLEDPIEFIHGNSPALGLVNQREIGRDCLSFADGLRAALRQDPDVLLVGELRDSDSARLALMAAETGHLVMATLHTASAIGAIDRLLSLFPADERGLAQAQLADTLRAVMAQQLVWSIASAGSSSTPRAQACREVLIATPAVRHLIREHRLGDIEHIMQTQAALGMQTMAQAMAALPS
ncbi:MAG: ATPase, T2SS/T4P/T4SS family [Paraperlucidibaca sp.]